MMKRAKTRKPNAKNYPDVIDFFGDNLSFIERGFNHIAETSRSFHTYRSESTSSCDEGKYYNLYVTRRCLFFSARAIRYNQIAALRDGYENYYALVSKKQDVDEPYLGLFDYLTDLWLYSMKKRRGEIRIIQTTLTDMRSLRNHRYYWGAVNKLETEKTRLFRAKLYLAQAKDKTKIKKIKADIKRREKIVIALASHCDDIHPALMREYDAKIHDPDINIESVVGQTNFSQFVRLPRPKEYKDRDIFDMCDLTHDPQSTTALVPSGS